MRRVNIVALLTAAAVVFTVVSVRALILLGVEPKHIKIGIIHVGDGSDAYTENFLKAENAIEQEYGDEVELIQKYNVNEGNETEALEEFAQEGCSLVFANSYGHGEGVKSFAKEHPDIEFCQATCSNANEEPVLKNYHTFMGEIYQGRYICGVAAGMKLAELVNEGECEAKVGYVAAYPYAEVISGYTAFFLGVRSVVDDATMKVIYTDSWGNYSIEKKAAQRLIDEGCAIISQHSDTTGPAIACESSGKKVFHVGYNRSMANIAPTTHLIDCRINWEPYMKAAVYAVLNDKRIESCVDGRTYGRDASGGIDKGWVEILRVNEIAAAPGTAEKVEELEKSFAKGKNDVFKGDYIGVDPFDETDIYDLSEGYTENKNSSAPTFHYVLKDVIEIE